MIYEPQEDSYLLAGEVGKRARGKVLDMGTGSGIQALTAEKNKGVNSVTVADVDTEVLSFVSSMHFEVIETNLFENIYEKYDFIIFNPPYLPDNPKDPQPSLDGGPTGREMLDQFLEDAPTYLNKGGEILFVQSSITGIEETE